MKTQELFAIMSSIIIISMLLSGFLMDRFGRKKIIVLKVFFFLMILTALIIIGFVGDTNIPKQLAPTIFFLGIFFATFSFDMQIIGFESLCKLSRENYIITLSATRILGICILCVSFFVIKKWVYFFVILLGL